MNAANILTVIRIALVPVFLVFAALGNNITALAVFAVAAITDFLDGKIARKYNLVSDFGKLTDPFADKLLVMSAILVFVAMGIIPVWAATVILGREFAVTSLRMIAASKGIVIAAGMSGKVKTFVHCIALCIMLLLWDKAIPVCCCVSVQDILVYAMTAISLYSCVDYFIKNSYVLKGEIK